MAVHDNVVLMCYDMLKQNAHSVWFGKSHGHRPLLNRTLKWVLRTLVLRT
jgi:hypothetical protein